MIDCGLFWMYRIEYSIGSSNREISINTNVSLPSDTKNTLLALKYYCHARNN